MDTSRFRGIPLWLVVATVVAWIFGAMVVSSCSSSDSPAPPAGSSQASAATARTAYLAAATGVLDSLVTASSTASDVLGRANLTSDAWKQESASAFAAFAPIEARAAQLQPPQGLEALQDQLLQAAQLYRQGADLLKTGVGSLDLNAISQGADLVSQGVTAIGQASTTLKSVS